MDGQSLGLRFFDGRFFNWRSGLWLMGWIAVCFAVAAISSFWTAREVAGWYRTLIRPSFAPPNWVFAPLWSLLYLIMAIAAWFVWQSPISPTRSWGIAFFLTQLALNFAWTWIFFHRHALSAAVFEIAVLWLAIAATIWIFHAAVPAAGWMLVPYLAWVSFAAGLTFEFWRLNR